VLAHRRQITNFEALDADLSQVITPWFNIGFLELRQMDWSSPANVLHKIISYEAVHEVKGWDDLRRRVKPADRRCFAFFHPRMPDEPLIFVEVALMQDIPADIGSVLDDQRTPIAAGDARVAVFYSISNCQEGLRGIPFGNTLIKLVVELLSRQLPKLRTFVTLSPLPGFAGWLAERLQAQDSPISAANRAQLAKLGPDWTPDGTDPVLRQAMLAAAAHYLLDARNPNGKVIDPVARFHLGNGAQLERINFAADMSDNGLRQAHGLMVNYLYKSNRIVTNAQRFAEAGEIAASPETRRLLAA
jgi:malonyl-CoA decarboxylase